MLRRALLCLVVLSGLACTSARSCKSSSALSGFDCAGIERCDELLAVVGAFIEAHRNCVFPPDVNRRMTSACGRPEGLNSGDGTGEGSYECLGPIEVVSWSRELPVLIDFVIRSKKQEGRELVLLACLDAEGGWLLYWPMPADSEIKDVF